MKRSFLILLTCLSLAACTPQTTPIGAEGAAPVAADPTSTGPASGTQLLSYTLLPVSPEVLGVTPDTNAEVTMAVAYRSDFASRGYAGLVLQVVPYAQGQIVGPGAGNQQMRLITEAEGTVSRQVLLGREPVRVDQLRISTYGLRATDASFDPLSVGLEQLLAAQDSYPIAFDVLDDQIIPVDYTVITP